ncbi:Hypothetical_protein [Hexamita inflata]|uniref:Hypothetical_protein n=1 Tax=Hexamita inflata TaxID=28002 RepID=A0AA86RTV6_9EUKA|nr:Hypothetical protein HINF_LOCUS60085 [Hexamita inflata]
MFKVPLNQTASPSCITTINKNQKTKNIVKIAKSNKIIMLLYQLKQVRNKHSKTITKHQQNNRTKYVSEDVSSNLMIYHCRKHTMTTKFSKLPQKAQTTELVARFASVCSIQVDQINMKSHAAEFRNIKKIRFRA